MWAVNCEGQRASNREMRMKNFAVLKTGHRLVDKLLEQMFDERPCIDLCNACSPRCIAQNAEATTCAAAELLVCRMGPTAFVVHRCTNFQNDVLDVRTPDHDLSKLFPGSAVLAHVTP